MIEYKRENLNAFPDEIFSLRDLKILHLHKSHLTELSDRFEFCPQLAEVSFYQNDLAKIPDSIFKLKNLQRLNFGDNRISVLSY
ncbi:MAG TPA: hypothetical protein PKA26_12685, partial [bacterium]|nr:hypothetical protein [bacterium]